MAPWRVVGPQSICFTCFINLCTYGSAHLHYYCLFTKIPVYSFRSQLILESRVLSFPNLQLYILIIVSFVFGLFLPLKTSLYNLLFKRESLKEIISKEIIFSLSLVFENFTMMSIGVAVFSFIVLGTWGIFRYGNSCLKFLYSFLVLFLWQFSLSLFSFSETSFSLVTSSDRS